MAKASVLLCTSGGLFGSLSLQALLAADEIEVAGVFVSTRTRSKHGNLLSDARRILQTSGLKYTVYLAWGTLLFDLLRLPGYSPTVKALARCHGIPCIQARDINSAACQKWLAARRPDYLLSSFFNQKITADTRAIAHRGAVNLHPALLPAYKGVDPLFYYFLRDERLLGVSLHRLAEDFDTGEILGQCHMHRVPGRSVFWHNVELFRQGLELFIDWLAQPTASPEIANTAATDSYDSWPSPAEVKSLDWSLVRWRDLHQQATRPFSAKPD